MIADERFIHELTQANVRALAVPANERAKSLDAQTDLILQLRQMGANRQTRLVALGGGVIQDIATFVASVYMRGVEWVYLPTTVLAMVDSCIGGKSSINVGAFKNLIGTFHPPEVVKIDPALALTLTDEQRVSGLVEAAKICYCRGFEVFQEYLRCEPKASMTGQQMEMVIIASLNAKKWFIEIDEFDKKERLLLNFGHTFGHAIESASHFRIVHGIAVGVGIQCAIELGRELGRSYAGTDSVTLLETHLGDLLSGIPGLRDEIKTLSMTEIQRSFEGDKKHKTDLYTVILPADSGAAELMSFRRTEETMRTIEAAMIKALRRFC
ncbi:MAG: 3-dehydroquinate synthase family protein [Terracidiphilus sp.]